MIWESQGISVSAASSFGISDQVVGKLQLDEVTDGGSQLGGSMMSRSPPDESAGVI
jgi:hypothetical protein